MEIIMVSVICKTFNHERYIRKCLDSLVRQKTKFNYEIIVHDDASSDGTADIIKEFEKRFPDKIVAIYQKENQHSQKINSTKKFIFPICRGKYIAICEGDDFWVDDNKLQKQVDFLESHDDYVLCGHSAYYANEDSSLVQNEFFNYGNGSRTLSTEEIISGWVMSTNSLVFRFSALKEYPVPYKGKARNGDYALMTYLALQGKVYFIDELMSAYRRTSIGSVNWIWRYNLELQIKDYTEFINLLSRLNEYTNGKYEASILKIKQKFQFDILVTEGKWKQAKEMKQFYSKLTFSKKFSLFFHSMFPKLFIGLRNTRNRIQMSKNRGSKNE